MPTRPFSQPSPDRWGLVCDVIVHHEMDVEFARHGGLDLVEELAELGSTVASVALADDSSGCNVESGEQRCSAVPLVVVAPSGRLAGTHRQHRLTAVQRLDLGLLIHA